jgi:hypothetical protein
VYAGALRYFSSVRSFLKKLATQAGVRDPDALAAQWHILVWGSIIGARAKDRHAARRAKEIAAAILAREGRPARRGRSGVRADKR